MASGTTVTEYDDTLSDLNGVCLFDPASNGLNKQYPFLRERTKAEWNTLGEYYNEVKKDKEIFIRFVNPKHPRFGSIAKINPRDNFYNYGFGYSQKADITRRMDNWNRTKSFYCRMRWEKRGNRPQLSSYYEQVEWLPDYKGPTVWAYDPSRAKRAEPTVPYDRLEREIKVGDFCCYILYYFDGQGAAGIYFGNVTKIDDDGTVYCTNVTLNSKEKSDEKRVKNNSLITILTEDLMQQLMLAKLSSSI